MLLNVLSGFWSNLNVLFSWLLVLYWSLNWDLINFLCDFLSLWNLLLFDWLFYWNFYWLLDLLDWLGWFNSLLNNLFFLFLDLWSNFLFSLIVLHFNIILLLFLLVLFNTDNNYNDYYDYNYYSSYYTTSNSTSLIWRVSLTDKIFFIFNFIIWSWAWNTFFRLIHNIFVILEIVFLIFN